MLRVGCELRESVRESERDRFRVHPPSNEPVSSIFDMFDGAMARVSNTAAIFGAFFDSMLDRYSESIIFLGLLIYALQRDIRCICMQ